MSLKAQSILAPGEKTQGISLTVGKASNSGKVVGTDGDDIISIRASDGNNTTTVAKGGDDTVILYGSDQIPEGNYHEMLEDLKKNPFKTATQYFNQSKAHVIGLGSGEDNGADTISLVSELGATSKVIKKHTGSNGKVNGKGVAGENNQAFDHWAGVFGFVNVVDFDPAEDTLELAGHTTTLGESFTKNGHFFQAVYSEQNADDQSGPRAGAAHDDTFLGLIKFKDGAANADAIAEAITVNGMENYVVDGTGKQVFEGDSTSNQTGEELFGKNKASQGAVLTAGKDSDSHRLVGTEGDDIISIRTFEGDRARVDAKGGDDTIILYGSDQIPEGNYHDMLKSLKRSPHRTATRYFDQSQAHTIRLGAGEGEGADTVSLVSELGATPEVIAKHTRANGKVNGKGVAGENDQAFDHWAGVFGYVNIVDFDATEDTLELAGHTTTLGESFTKNGHFFQTVYSEQNADDKSGPRAGAAHDDTFLGLIKFKDGAPDADAIAESIKVNGMENYVVDGTGTQVFENDPTSNQTQGTISPGPLMTFALADTETDEIVAGFENLTDNAEIDLNGIDLEKYTVVARINQDHPDADRVESVRFESSAGDRVENVDPYTLFANRGSDYFGRTVQTGDFTVKATAYAKNGGKGEVLAANSVDYTVIDSQQTATSMPDETDTSTELYDQLGSPSDGADMLTNTPVMDEAASMADGMGQTFVTSEGDAGMPIDAMDSTSLGSDMTDEDMNGGDSFSDSLAADAVLYGETLAAA